MRQNLEQVILPKEMRITLIGDMPIGSKSCSMEWAMYVDQDGKCWVNLDYPADKHAGGTVDTWLERVDEGFIVYPKLGSTWNLSGRTQSGKWAPVVGIVVQGTVEAKQRLSKLPAFGGDRSYRYLLSQQGRRGMTLEQIAQVKARIEQERRENEANGVEPLNIKDEDRIRVDDDTLEMIVKRLGFEPKEE